MELNEKKKIKDFTVSFWNYLQKPVSLFEVVLFRKYKWAISIHLKSQSMMVAPSRGKKTASIK